MHDYHLYHFSNHMYYFDCDIIQSIDIESNWSKLTLHFWHNFRTHSLTPYMLYRYINNLRNGTTHVWLRNRFVASFTDANESQNIVDVSYLGTTGVCPMRFSDSGVSLFCHHQIYSVNLMQCLFACSQLISSIAHFEL